MEEYQRWTTRSANETTRLGALIAKKCHPGDIFALSGDLAAGKTTFIQGFCKALEVRSPVTSPTFTLINEYSGTLPIYHFDCYRLEGPAEMESLGYEEYFYGDGVVLIEWADRVESLLPATTVRLEFHHEYQQPDTRTIVLSVKEEREELCVSLP